jgi:hypothetical protein
MFRNFQSEINREIDSYRLISIVAVRSVSNPKQDFLMRELMESIYKFTPASRRPCELGAV